jgi:hypothetical protein
MEANFRKTPRFTEASRRLLSGKYVIRSKNPKAFQVIADNTVALTEYFSLSGGDLTVNETLGVAYLLSNPEDDESTQIRFGKRSALRAIETLALVLIRKQRLEYFDSSTAESESPVLDQEKLKAAMATVIKKPTEKAFNQDYKTAIDALKDLQVLLGEDDKLVISPVADIALPSDEITSSLIAAEKYFSRNGVETND